MFRYATSADSLVPVGLRDNKNAWCLSSLVSYSYSHFWTINIHVCKSVSGRKSADILNDISGVPDVGFVTKKPKNARTARPVSEFIPENRLQKKENRRSLQHHYQGSSSEDEDEKTNRAASNKNKSPGSTFSVGMASRKLTKESEQEDESDHEETCEYCLAEKVGNV